MKYLLLAATLLFLFGCTTTNRCPTGLPHGAQKFYDGDVVCYIYYGNGISCLRQEKQ